MITFLPILTSLPMIAFEPVITSLPVITREKEKMLGYFKYKAQKGKHRVAFFLLDVCLATSQVLIRRPLASEGALFC